jgi:hypothetical protein
MARHAPHARRFTWMEPRPDLTSTAYALADLGAISVCQPKTGGSASTCGGAVDFAGRWLDMATGEAPGQREGGGRWSSIHRPRARQCCLWNASHLVTQ